MLIWLWVIALICLVENRPVASITFLSAGGQFLHLRGERQLRGVTLRIIPKTKNTLDWVIRVPTSYHFPPTSHVLIYHILINKCLWNSITLITLMIKTSHTFAVKFHTNPAVFIQHACCHSVIQKDKLNAQIFSYHIHILFRRILIHKWFCYF